MANDVITEVLVIACLFSGKLKSSLFLRGRICPPCTHHIKYECGQCLLDLLTLNMLERPGLIDLHVVPMHWCSQECDAKQCDRHPTSDVRAI